MTEGKIEHREGSGGDEAGETLGAVTFRTLAEREGGAWTDPLPQVWPLERWFAAVCDVPLDSLPVGDLARACRQRSDLGEVVPRCLRALDGEPLAGELYEGELLTAVIGLPPAFWRDHPELEARAVAAAQAAFDQADEYDDERLLRNILSFVGERDAPGGGVPTQDVEEADRAWTA